MILQQSRNKRFKVIVVYDMASLGSQLGRPGRSGFLYVIVLCLIWGSVNMPFVLVGIIIVNNNSLETTSVSSLCRQVRANPDIVLTAQ